MFKLCQLMHDKDLPEANDCFWPRLCKNVFELRECQNRD